jgi:hypothetical protein
MPCGNERSECAEQQQKQVEHGAEL